ncbi:MAG TPA: hypothetical protein VEH50_07435 [Methylomirabilota bacterium]|jgi:hypothetical protein|nr:hypothetical protein [Methylomirabilota bacterium]
MTTRIRTCAAVVCMFSLIAPAMSRAWGSNAERLIANKAVDTLPPEMQPFFDANRDFIGRHATDPLDWLDKSPATEQRNHYIMLDKYGKFPFAMLPRNYKAAVTKYGKTKVVANGVLPWQIGVYSEKLTDALRSGNWEQAKLAAAWLAGYVAESYDPFDTTENFDGRISGQPGVNQRFSSGLVDKYSLFFPLRPNDASFISDPTDHAFDACLDSYAWLDNILLADARARRGLSDYGDDYYDRFYNLAGAIVIRQLSDASTDVGSYWMTAWINAGRPALPSH